MADAGLNAAFASEHQHARRAQGERARRRQADVRETQTAADEVALANLIGMVMDHVTLAVLSCTVTALKRVIKVRTSGQDAKRAATNALEGVDSA